MTWLSSTASTRRAKPSHEPWIPLPYMARAVEHLTTHHIAVLPLQPSGRKTSITLSAFNKLKADGVAKTMLVVAPLRACRLVWRQEGQKWTEFRSLRFSLLHGPKKAERLKDDADIWLINPEGVDWLCKHFDGRNLPFDIVTIDELTKFSNPQATRSKALRNRTTRTKWMWGLTGSFAAKGYMGTFGEMLVLDKGAALGKYITHFRAQYFQVGFDGFTYDIMPGGEARIEAKLAPYMFYMDPADYAQLPGVVDDVRELEMEPKERSVYDRMKKDMLVELEGGIITAVNSAACYSKLAQMANGAVYIDKAKGKYEVLHDLKLDAIEELMDELDGIPLMVAYEFQHDLWRLKQRFGKDLPFLGSGLTPKQEEQWVNDWNENRIPLFAIHPASAGHALNLHEGGAMHIAQFGITWDWELYDQLIRRIRRSGSAATQIFNHIFKVRGTIDELKLEALCDKDMTERRMMQGINALLLNEGESTMAVQKLSRDGGTEAPRKLPPGWGKPKAEVTEADVVELVQSDDRAPYLGQEQGERIVPMTERKTFGQRARIQQAIAPQNIQQGEDGETEEVEQVSRASAARAAFSPKVRQQLEAAGRGEATPEGMGDAIVETYPTKPVQTDIEDIAPTEQPQRGANKPSQQAAPAKVKRQPAASAVPLGDSARNVTEETQLRVALLQLADGDVERAREMLAFVNESP